MNTSGVYQLQFSSCRTYIGKSINIEERFNQHMDKFRKGAAAKTMQNEYDQYGPPSLTILALCHPDHVDIVESWLINRNIPELNTTRPSDPFIGVRNIEELLSMLHMSTVQHVDQIILLDKTCTEALELYDGLRRELSESEEYIVKLEHIRSVQELEKDISGRVRLLELALDIERKESQARIHCLAKVVEYYKMPWWKRLFS